MEFYELETFTDRTEFMQKVYCYELFFNFLRHNCYKEYKTLLQMLKEKAPEVSERTMMLPSVDIDALLRKNLAHSTTERYYLSFVPS